jgi:Protein of unknown function (DUF3035)
VVVAGLLQLGGCGRGTVQDALGMSKRAPDEFAVVRRAPLILPPDYDLRPPDPGAPRPNIGTTSDQARVAMTSQAELSPAAQALAGAAAPSTGQAVPGSAAGAASGGVPASVIADDLLSAGTNMPSNSPAAVAGPTSTTAAVTAPTTTAAPVAAPASAPADGRGETPGERAMVALAGGNQADPDIRRTIAEENQTLAEVEASLFTRIVNWREPSTLGATIDAPAEAQRLRDNKAAGRAPTEGDTPTVVNRRQSALQGLLEDLF